MKRIILCADDYGQNTAISQAIIELLREKRLSATSCMTHSYSWPEHAEWLKPYINQCDIGLHFDLTGCAPHEMPLSSLSELLLKAYLKQLNQSIIEKELNHQLDRFVDSVGQVPNFIDGHQHIHQLPIIRDALFNVYENRLRNSGCYIRSVNQPRMLIPTWNIAYFKTAIIQLCGSFNLKKKLIKKNIPHNTSFSGIYDFSEASRYAMLFPHFLQQIKQGGIIMCHPGLLASENAEDPIANARNYEYRYFASDKFLQDCNSHQIEIGRFRE